MPVGLQAIETRDFVVGIQNHSDILRYNELLEEREQSILLKIKAWETTTHRLDSASLT